MMRTEDLKDFYVLKFVQGPNDHDNFPVDERDRVFLGWLPCFELKLFSTGSCLKTWSTAGGVVLKDCGTFWTWIQLAYIIMGDRTDLFASRLTKI